VLQDETKKDAAEISVPATATSRFQVLKRLRSRSAERKGMERYMTPFIVVPMTPVALRGPLMASCCVYASWKTPKFIAMPRSWSVSRCEIVRNSRVAAHPISVVAGYRNPVR
jgi:hypothetical protein